MKIQIFYLIKNSLRASWQSKPFIEPHAKDIDFQLAEIVYSNKDIQEAGKITSFLNQNIIHEEFDNHYKFKKIENVWLKL